MAQDIQAEYSLENDERVAAFLDRCIPSVAPLTKNERAYVNMKCNIEAPDLTLSEYFEIINGCESLPLDSRLRSACVGAVDHLHRHFASGRPFVPLPRISVSDLACMDQGCSSEADRVKQALCRSGVGKLERHHAAQVDR